MGRTHQPSVVHEEVPRRVVEASTGMRADVLPDDQITSVPAGNDVDQLPILADQEGDELAIGHLFLSD
jgi:hypothetical protein